MPLFWGRNVIAFVTHQGLGGLPLVPVGHGRPHPCQQSGGHQLQVSVFTPVAYACPSHGLLEAESPIQNAGAGGCLLLPDAVPEP